MTTNQSKRVQEKCGFKFLKKVILPTQMQEEKEGNLNIIYKNDIGILNKIVILIEKNFQILYNR